MGSRLINTALEISGMNVKGKERSSEVTNPAKPFHFYPIERILVGQSSCNEVAQIKF